MRLKPHMRWLLPTVAVCLFGSPARAERPDPVCARLAATMDARINAPASTGPRKVWVSWMAIDDLPDLAAALAGKVERVLGTRDGSALVVATRAQLVHLPSGAAVTRDADELDWVGCGSLGYQAPPLGRVAPQVAVPAAWQTHGSGRVTYCLQLAVPPLDDVDQGTLAVVLGASDPVPLDCSSNGPGTCTLALTPREAAAVARLRFVRGVIRREPAFKIGSSLACPDGGDLPIAPADLPAVLRAATARPDERIAAVVQITGEPEELVQLRARLPRGATIIAGSESSVTVSLTRRSLPALAALPQVTLITAVGPPPTLDGAAGPHLD